MSKMKKIFITAMFITLVISCKTEVPEDFYKEDQKEIADYIIENKETYSRFYEIMITGELSEPLNAYNPFGNGFTLFLPTDEAFDRYIQNNNKYSSFDDLLRDVDFVRKLGRYHLVHTSLQSNEFPYGVLPDTTSSGDLLTIGFSSSLDSTIYKVNNIAPVLEPNLEMLNGYIHVIGEVLEPIIYTGYEWLEQNQEFSILTSALNLTGVSNNLEQFRYTSRGQKVKNRYTILAEYDSTYQRYGINSIEDLISRYNTPGLDYTDTDNYLYQFTAYHVLEGSYYLVDFQGNRNYNSLGNYPVSIRTELEILINKGIDTFALDISPGGDSTYIDYISLYYQESDVPTKTGAVHFLNQLMEPVTPNPSTVTYQFYQEPEIYELRFTPGTHEFDEPENLEVISWTGPESISYIKSSSSTHPAHRDDYILIDGRFTIEYTIPKILPGRYGFYLRTGVGSTRNANIRVFLDEQKKGSNIDLTLRPSSSVNSYNNYKVGVVEFAEYQEHTVTIKTLIPGRLIWDYVQFRPEN